VSPRLPQASGQDVVKLLTSLGYEVVRQRGSHIRLRFVIEEKTHFITVPDHRTVAKGTLSDILTAVSRATNIPKKDLRERLRRV
jgi:predicted RNA binding protein YcfA (HicA-like mRNA interferase family)